MQGLPCMQLSYDAAPMTKASRPHEEAYARPAWALVRARATRNGVTKGSGHFRVKIYSKPEVPVIGLYAAKKQSVFHTELHALWSMQALPIDMLRFPRQWRAHLMVPFFSFGAAHGDEKTDHQCPKLWFSSPGSLSYGLLWPMQDQQPVEKLARFLCRALKSQTLRLSV